MCDPDENTSVKPKWRWSCWPCLISPSTEIGCKNLLGLTEWTPVLAKWRLMRTPWFRWKYLYEGIVAERWLSPGLRRHPRSPVSVLENGRVRAGYEGLSPGHVLGGTNINIVVDKNEYKSWTWRSLWVHSGGAMGEDGGRLVLGWGLG